MDYQELLDTIVAIEGSVAKWEAIVAGTGRDEGIKNCPLCKMFLFPVPIDEASDEDELNFQQLYNSAGDCKRCPVRLRSGKQRCVGTPYETYSDLEFDNSALLEKNEQEHKAAMDAAALAELEFLKSILVEWKAKLDDAEA